MSIETSRKIIEAYFGSDHADSNVLAEDVVFTEMASGIESRTPKGVQEMLDWFYNVAFKANSETTNLVFADGHAVWEGFVTGKHTGEFAGIPATNKEVRVPICVSYDIEDEKIKRGRIYFSVASFMAQVS